ncbi:hypothetical protein [Mucilaginibacter arboris]|uniref:Uncharacterized protein n=1 Tax=Mucilaginibacter arboris TaxID=2682090 RepID=A0A7K1T027_9SPHI|nr:hypothetical protein [Mucilaginibacter arboris]MVN22916.1 hypothetical protein [Mucilaginibacter arboris]
MATTNNLNDTAEEQPLTTTGGPTDQLAPEGDAKDNQDFEDDDDAPLDDELAANSSDFDDEPIEDEDEDLDDDEVKRLFPGEDSYTEDEDDDEPYEGIRHGDQEDEGLVDDNMTGMPVIPSPS